MKEGRPAHHLVDFLEREHGLSDDAPALVGVGVVAEILGGHHESGDEAEERARQRTDRIERTGSQFRFASSSDGRELRAPSFPVGRKDGGGSFREEEFEDSQSVS